MKTELNHFTFTFKSHGHYKVTYTAPKTNKQYIAVITDMPLIDSTKNANTSKTKDLNTLKARCKSKFSLYNY